MKLFIKPSELLVTDTNLPNRVLDDNVHHNLTVLMYILNTLRVLVDCPITVLSGFRSEKVNAAVGGSKNSYHLQGRAADVTCDKLHELLDLCLKLHKSHIFEEVIYYPDKNFIHVAI